MASKNPQNQHGWFRHFKGAGFVFLGVGIFLTSFLRQCYNPQTRARFPATEMAVGTNDEAARRVDELCASLPVPEQFYFVSKSAPNETARFVSITFNFRSARAKEEIYPLFILWFTQNGWTDNKAPFEPLEFSSGDQTVWIAPYNLKEEDFYAVRCTEWKIAPEDFAPPIKTPDQKR